MSYVTTIQLPPSTEYVTQTEVFRKTVYTSSYVTVPYTTYLTDTVVLTQTVTTTVKAPTPTPTTQVTQTVTQTLTTAVTPTTPTVSPEIRNKLESDLSSIESKIPAVSTASELTVLLSKYAELLRSYDSLGVRIPDVEARLDRVRKAIQDKVASIVSSELGKVRPEDPETSRRLLDSLKNWLNSISKTYGVDVTQALNAVATAESKLTTTLVIQELRGKVLPQVSELESQIPKITLKNELIDALNKLNSILSTYNTYKARGVSDPDLESRLESVRKSLEGKLYLITINELTSLDLRDLNVAKMRVNNFETWLNSLKQYGISVPKDIEDVINSAKAQIDGALLLKSEAYSKLSARDKEALDFIASKLARLYTTAEFLSKGTWDAIRSSLGLTDDNVNLIMRYVRGEKLSDEELRKLADIYVNLQLNKTLDNEAIVKEIEKRIPIYTPEGIEFTPSLSDYERELKEKILRGETPQVTPGRQITWAVEDTLKLTDLVGRGYDAVYSFLRDKGLPPGIASAIASALVTAGITAVGMIPGVGAPLALGLIGASLANFTAQTLETLTDEYERKVFTEEFSKIIDPSKAPPEQRAMYEELRQELIGSIAGAVAGGVGAVGISKLTPKIAEKLSTLLKNRYPQLAEKLQNFAKTSLTYGELQAKTQDWAIYYDKDSGLLTINLIEKGDITKPVATAKIPIQEYMIVTKGKSQEGLVGLVKTLRQVYGKEDVSDEVKAVLDRIKTDVEKLGLQLNDENVARFLNNYRSFISKLSEVAPQELRGKSLTEIAEKLVFVKYGDKDVPALDLGEKLKFISGDKVVDVSKGALASLEVVDRLKSLNVFDDVVSLLQRGITGEKGVIIKGDRVIEIYPDGRLVITRGLNRETYTVFDPRYLMEARRLLENYDNELLKSLGKVVTAPYTTQPQLQPVTASVDIIPDTLKNTFKVAGDYMDISLTSEGKTLRVMLNKELRGAVGDESGVLRLSLDVSATRDRSLLDKLFGRLPGYERFRGEVVVINENARRYLNKYISGRTPTKEELKNAVENALKEVAGKDPEATGALKQLQVLLTSMERSSGNVIPVMISDTGKELVIGVATTTASLSKLTPEDIQKLGLEEKVLVEGLKPMYIETTYPVPVVQPYEVSQPVFIPESVEIPLEKSEDVKLKPIYVEVPYQVPVILPYQLTQPVFTPETVEIPYTVEETVRLKPVYIEEFYSVPVEQSVRFDYPVFIPESIEVPIEKSESVSLKPVYIDVPYLIPVEQVKEETRPIYIPESIEIPLETSETVKLRPIYIDVPYLIPVTQSYEVTKPVFIPETVEIPTAVDETTTLKPIYIEEVYTIPILKEVQRTELVTQPEEVVINLIGKQLADVVVVPIEVPSLITVYYPYSEPLPIPPQIPPYALGVVPTPPTTPKPSPEELKAKTEAKKAREVEKIVL